MEFFQRLNKLRRKILVISLMTLLFLCLGILSLAFLEDHVAFIVTLVLSILLIFLSIALIAVLVMSYKRLFKEELVRELLSDSFEDLVYTPDGGIDENTVKNTEMIAMGNTYTAGDYIEGRYKGVRFMQSDVAIRQVVSMGEELNTVTFFDGRWMVFTFDSSFVTDLKIKEKSFSSVQQVTKEGRAFVPYAVEDADFNRFFRVYTDDPEKAGYILTQKMRQAILSVNYAIRGDMMFYFHENTLHVGLHGTRDAFEPPILRKLDREVLKKEVLADISVITAFVDGLLLDQELFVPLEMIPSSPPDGEAGLPESQRASEKGKEDDI